MVPAHRLRARAVSRAVALAIIGCLASTTPAGRASAQPPMRSPIVDRDFAIDLYVGAAFGTPRMIAMGGTATAVAEGSPGTLSNPASAAMRPKSSRGNWDWDGHLDGFVPSLGTDFDNNGVASTGTLSVGVGDGGLAGFYREWGMAASFGKVSYHVAPSMTGGDTAKLTADTTVLRVVLARAFLGEAVRAGVGIRTGSFLVSRDDDDLFESVGAGLEAGVILSPPQRQTRWGARVSLPVLASQFRTSCDPLDCHGRVLPGRAIAPWEIALGMARRWAPTAWNRVPQGRYADERAVTVAADVLVTGTSSGGAGIESFTEGLLQASGRTIVTSVRLGTEWELWPGQLRLRGGGYWEPARMAPVPGRAHLTAGGELRLFKFHFWDEERRLAVSLSGDAAHRYGNVGVALGFWH